MAKILYGLSGLGYGHATRGKPILESLRKEHEVIVLTDGCSYDYLSECFDNVERICTETICFSKNKVDVLKTVIVNVKNSFRHFKSGIKIVKLFRKFKPDLIINDFSYALNYLGFLFKVPVIGIDNESVVTTTKIDVPQNKYLSFLRTLLIVKLIVPRAARQLVPTFFEADTKDEKKTILCKPSLREKIQKLKSKQGKHVLVYRYGDVGDDLVKVLSKLSGEFIVYGFNGSSHNYSNIIFKQFGDKNYWGDLASCKAIISYGGFSLTSEALFLGKPVLAIPIKGQFEQELNAHYIKKLGYGDCFESADREGIKNFLRNIPNYKKNIKEHKNEYPSLLSVLKKEIDNLLS